MRNLLIVLFTITLLLSCGPEHPTEYLTFAGKIENTNDSILTIRGGKINKKITLDENGNFKDTLRLNQPGNYTMFLGDTLTSKVYLDNGYDLFMNGDALEFNFKTRYTGYGSQTPNYLNSQFDYAQNIGNPRDFFLMEKDSFDAKLASVKRGFDSIDKLFDDVDKKMYKQARDFNNQFLTNMAEVYEPQHKRALELKKRRDAIKPGQPSPEFYNYINFKGGKSSLKDYRGKYVYIDLWATWCKPCIAQLPFLEDLRKDYKNKNLYIVSIATDDDKTARSQGGPVKAWKDFLKKERPTGIQLLAVDNQFMIDYLVSGIPRFILLDPQGKIIDSDAPRPFDPELKKKFKELGI